LEALIVAQLELVVTEDNIRERRDGGDLLKCDKEVSYGLILTVGHSMLIAKGVNNRGISY